MFGQTIKLLLRHHQGRCLPDPADANGTV